MLQSRTDIGDQRCEDADFSMHGRQVQPGLPGMTCRLAHSRKQQWATRDRLHASARVGGPAVPAHQLYLSSQERAVVWQRLMSRVVKPLIARRFFNASKPFSQSARSRWNCPIASMGCVASPTITALACALVCCLPELTCTSSTRRRLPSQKVCSTWLGRVHQRRSHPRRASGFIDTLQGPAQRGDVGIAPVTGQHPHHQRAQRVAFVRCVAASVLQRAGRHPALEHAGGGPKKICE